jgi:hypothetical protein
VDSVAEPVVVVVGNAEVWVLELDLKSVQQQEELLVVVVVVESGLELEHFVAAAADADADDFVVPVVAGGVAVAVAESAADYVADVDPATAVDGFVVAAVVEASS